jgi:hypothetical protein
MVRNVGMIHIGGRVHSAIGCGMGSVILNKGGAGTGSTYTSLEDYEKTTGNTVGAGLNEKLAKLMVQPLSKKPSPIRF